MSDKSPGLEEPFVVPEGHTEESVLEAIERCVSLLAPSFVFGYFDIDDIKQEARRMGLRCLKKYDPSRPIGNFVYRHIRNRLINFKRDNLRRTDPPCLRCHSGSPCSYAGETASCYCRKYAEWLARNNLKANLMRPTGLDYVPDEREKHTQVASTTEVDAEIADLREKIDRELPIELRSYYLQMRDGVTIPRNKRQEVLDAVKAIVGDIGERQEEDDG